MKAHILKAFALDIGGAVIDIKPKSKKLERSSIYNALRFALGANYQQYTMTRATITKVAISAKVTSDNKQSFKTKNFTITSPNSCSLGYEEAEGELRKMIVDSGLEENLDIVHQAAA